MEVIPGLIEVMMKLGGTVTMVGLKTLIRTGLFEPPF
jgi:hypothetical protein